MTPCVVSVCVSVQGVCVCVCEGCVFVQGVRVSVVRTQNGKAHGLSILKSVLKSRFQKEHMQNVYEHGL